MLKTKLRRPGFHARWVAPENVDRRLDMGYTMAKPEHYGGVSDKLIGEEKQIDSTIRRRKLVLMEIPEALAKQRDDYYEHLTKRHEESITRKYNKEVAAEGAESYEPSIP